MSTAYVAEIRARSDDNAMRVVRALMAWHGLTMPDVAAVIDASNGTIERRLSRNPKIRKGFLGWELDALAEYFGVPVQAFHTGEVDVATSRLSAPGRGSQPVTDGYSTDTARGFSEAA